MKNLPGSKLSTVSSVKRRIIVGMKFSGNLITLEGAGGVAK